MYGDTEMAKDVRRYRDCQRCTAIQRRPKMYGDTETAKDVRRYRDGQRCTAIHRRPKMYGDTETATDVRRYRDGQTKRKRDYHESLVVTISPVDCYKACF